MENLERMGISLDTTTKTEEAENVEEEEEGGTPGGTLAAADVLDKFRISDYDCIETDILDSAYSGKYITKYLRKYKFNNNNVYSNNNR